MSRLTTESTSLVYLMRFSLSENFLLNSIAPFLSIALTNVLLRVYVVAFGLIFCKSGPEVIKRFS